MIAGSEFADDVFGDIFAVARADQDEIRVVFVGSGANELVNAASERKNEDDRRNANGDAESGKESAAAVFAETFDGELDVGD